MLKFNKEKIWLTSDYHKNHINLCRGTSKWLDKSGCRDFDNLEDMWAVIRDNTNRLVKPEDILINLGDLLFGDKTKLSELLDEINCKNWVYLKGNHDDWMEKAPEVKNLFKYGVHDYLEVRINGRLFICSHYAMRTWRDQGKKSIQVYGHSHASLPDNPDLLSIDVVVDTCLFGHEKYTPYSFSEILNIMDRHKNHKQIDHHNSNTQ